MPNNPRDLRSCHATRLAVSVISGTAASAFDSGQLALASAAGFLEGCVIHARYLGLERERNAVDDKPIPPSPAALRPWCRWIPF